MCVGPNPTGGIGVNQHFFYFYILLCRWGPFDEPIFTEEGKKGKGEAVPLQAWTGPEGSKWFRLLDFKTIGT